MEIDIFALCDFAQDVGGKLTIVGTFDTIFADVLPAIHPTLSIVARLRFSDSEAGQHSFEISFSDDSGNKEVLPPFSRNLDVRIPSGEKWGNANIVIGIGQFQLPSYGKYYVNLSVDGKQVNSLPLNVKKVPKTPKHWDDNL
jgi:hypothetical protein